MADVLAERREGGILVVTLNRPEQLNAMSGDVQQRLGDTLTEAAQDPAVRCVVLTGAGRAFCAGGDVKSMVERAAEPAGAAAASAAAFASGIQELRARQLRSSYLLHTMPKPTIAMVNGVAAGAGLSLALACDLRAVSDQARFGTAFRNVALSGDYGGTYFLPRLVGMGRARELYFTAELIDAATALQYGMVNRVVPHADLEAETMTLAERLAAGPTLAFARMKENLTLAEHADLRTLLDQEALNIRLSSLTGDHREAARAFVEKRTAVFGGK